VKSDQTREKVDGSACKASSTTERNTSVRIKTKRFSKKLETSVRMQTRKNQN